MAFTGVHSTSGRRPGPFFTLAELQQEQPQFEAAGQVVLQEYGAFFQSRELGNYRPLRSPPAPARAVAVPPAVWAQLGRPAPAQPTAGAYPRE